MATESKAAAAEFIATLLMAAPLAHMLHLQTKSYAQHKALEELYTELPELVDSLAEAYQGCYGLIEDYPMPDYSTPHRDGLSLVEALKDYVDTTRADVADESQIQNLIDEIAGFLDGIAYKLKFLS